ncbi:bifunctional diguanylate cyclase/phosphodiesterase [Clostridium chauvoei]|uniref:bifunctional diguanylate cyclase/phosphodiesterase n=1 Tax=Clostridium chauvoei TaxID=46867 RepID=UPI001C859A65|nr:EAL domain-containing protein [Clostridium chauvoei]MBX7403035.1 EAL domain-containing protein [Clostridium chauvoei]
MNANIVKLRKQSVVIIISITLIYSGYIYWYGDTVRKDVEKDAYTYLSEVTKQNAEIIKTQIEGDFHTIKSIANFIGNKGDLQLEDLEYILQKEMEENSFKGMSIISNNNIYANVGKVKFSFQNETLLRKAYEGKTSISDTIVDEIDGELINVYSTPIYNKDDEIEAVLYATKLTKLNESKLNSLSFQGEGYSYIINKKGDFIYKSNVPSSVKEFNNIFSSLKDSKIDNKITINNIKQDFRNEQSGQIKYEINGVKKFMNYETLGINDWYIIEIVPTYIAYFKIKNTISNTLFLSVLTIILFGILVLHILIIKEKGKKELKRLAFQDEITGFSNWKKFQIESRQILNENHNINYAIIAFDIDKFKMINDIFGYDRGNEILKYIANFLNDFIHKNESFCRVSADNFGILLSYCDDENLIDRVKEIKRYINKFNNSYVIKISFGIHKVYNKKYNISVLEDRANMAKRSIKDKLNVDYAFYTEELRAVMLREKQIENNMESALKNKEFKVYLQPKYRIKDEKIIGAEALIRWIKPNGEALSPKDFIPIFEKNGFIQKLDKYVFEEICILISKWNKLKLTEPIVSISVNISRVDLGNTKIVDTLKEIIEKYNVDAKNIELELTESIVFEDKKILVNTLNKLKDIGFKISIDDFGSGYSSLNLLNDLPADIIKLDKAFLEKASEDKKVNMTIKNIIHMAKDLDLFTVAEGVETEEQLKSLREAGCDIAQGYYYAKPMAISEFEKIIHK